MANDHELCKKPIYDSQWDSSSTTVKNKHAIYLYIQTFADGRVMFARWSPTMQRCKLGPFHEKNASAEKWLEMNGNPTSPTITEIPFAIIDIGTESGELL